MSLIGCGENNLNISKENLKEISFSIQCYGGSTMGIYASLKETNFDVVWNLEKDSFKTENLIKILSNAKVKKHFQQKIGKVNIGGKININNIEHYFAYINYNSSGCIIDFYDMKEYWIYNNLSELNEFFMLNHNE